MARLAFLGSPEAAVVCLQALLEAGHDLRMVVSQPDKRRGRGSGTTASPVKQAALDAGLPVSDRLDDVVSCGAELGVVVAYGRIIPGRVLEALAMVNAHFSLLPRWRGAAPVERAILAGDQETGVCVMRLEEGLDTGPVLACRKLVIRNDEREHASTLTKRLSVLAAQLLVTVLQHGVEHLGPGEAQSGEPVYANKIEPWELRLDFTRSVIELERLVRLDRAWTTLRGQRLIVLDALALADSSIETPGGVGKIAGVDYGRELAPGTVVGTDVRAADGMLRLILVQPAGRRPLSATDWVRGVRLLPDERLGS